MKKTNQLSYQLLNCVYIFGDIYMTFTNPHVSHQGGMHKLSSAAKCESSGSLGTLGSHAGLMDGIALYYVNLERQVLTCHFLIIFFS